MNYIFGSTDRNHFLLVIRQVLIANVGAKSNKLNSGAIANHFLQVSFRVILGTGRNEFSLAGSTLKVEGSAIALKNFSDNFPDGGRTEGQIRYHHHYDVISFPEYISNDSPDVVLSLRK